MFIVGENKIQRQQDKEALTDAQSIWEETWGPAQQPSGLREHRVKSKPRESEERTKENIYPKGRPHLLSTD